MCFGLCLSPRGRTFRQPPWTGKAKRRLRVTKAARIQEVKIRNKREMWKQVDVLHAVSLCGICQLLSCVGAGLRDKETKQKATYKTLKE